MQIILSYQLFPWNYQMGILSKCWCESLSLSETKVLIDCCSDTTLLRKNVAQKWNLKRKQKQLIVTSALSQSHKFDSTTVSFDISLTSVSCCTKIYAQVVHCLKILFSWCSRDKKIHPRLKDIDFPVLKHSYVTLVIDTDYADLLLHRDFLRGQNRETTVAKITLGWLFMASNKIKGENCLCNYIPGSLINIGERIQNFWKLESYGTLPKMSSGLIATP